ncbi:MAG: hypothetical protein ABUS57_02220 [Pseudomonadota bacterium]
MKPRKFTPENRLARCFADPSGVLYKHALQRAVANVEAKRDSYLEVLDLKLDALIEMARHHGAGSASDLLYLLSQDVIADAGACKLADLSFAAHSLCDLLASEARGARFEAALRVHVDALVALRQVDPAARNPHSAAILAGLTRISQKCDR